MLDDPKKIDSVQVTSQTLEELLGGPFAEGRRWLALVQRIEVRLRLAARHTHLEGVHVELLAGQFDGTDPALGLESEKIAAFHLRTCVIRGSIVAQHLWSKEREMRKEKALPPRRVAGTGGLWC